MFSLFAYSIARLVLPNSNSSEPAESPDSDLEAKEYQLIGNGSTTRSRIEEFIRIHNPGIDEVYLKRVTEAYLAECADEGIDHDLAIAQMCHETNFLRFTGVVDRTQNNFAGIGAVFDAGHTFDTIQQGVRAHIQHLLAYASNTAPKKQIVDPRFHLVSRGIAKTIHDLAGRWAPDPRYGLKVQSIADRLIQQTMQ